MFIKKLGCVLSLLMILICAFTFVTAAARTGEFETYSIELKALTPDDLTEPVEIQLTHLTEGYVLKYYLYDINNYFSNELVPPGEYSVNVSVGNAEETDFTFIYEDRLFIEPSALAVSYTIIIDNASLEGDSSDNSTTVVPEESMNGEINTDDVIDNENPENVTEITDSNSEPDVLENTAPVVDEYTEEPSLVKSVLLSFVVPVLTLIVVAALLWFWSKNR